MLVLLRTASGGVAALVLLLVCAPRPAAAVRELRHLTAATDPATPLVAAISLVAWAVAAWLAVAVLLTVLSGAPGRLGAAASGLSRRWAPAALRRSLEVVLGLTVATSVVGVTTAHAAPGPAVMPERSSTAPVDGDAALPAAGPTQLPALDLDWPTAATPAPRPTSTPPDPPPTSPVASPAGGGASEPSGSPSVAVVVRPGDTLWGLAEDALRRAGVPAPSDARIACTWPRWWAANRDVIGDDPDLILPGTLLSPPADDVPAAPPGP